MCEEKTWKGLKEGIRGLQDPGTALIVVYISLVLFLLLFAGLESARADLGGDKEQVRQTVLTTALESHSRHTSFITIDQQVERSVEKFPATSYMKTNYPQRWPHDKVSGGTAKTATPELLMVLGFILSLLALLLAKDRKER